MNDPGLAFVLWTLVVLVIKFVGFDGVRALLRGFKSRLEKRIEEATRLYLETGEKNKDFRLLSYNHAETLERKRDGIIHERATTTLSNFEAYQECPSCGLKAHHHIEQIPSWTWLYKEQPMLLVRQCVSCKYKWIQK